MYRQNKIKPRKIASLLSQAAATNLKALTSQIRSEKEFKQKTKQNNKEKKKNMRKTDSWGVFKNSSLYLPKATIPQRGQTITWVQSTSLSSLSRKYMYPLGNKWGKRSQQQ